MMTKNTWIRWGLGAVSAFTLGCASTTIEERNIANEGFDDFGESGGFHSPSNLPLVTAEHPPPPIAGGTLAVQDGVALIGDAARLRALIVDIRTDDVRVIPTEGMPGRALIDGDTGYMLLRNRAELLRIDMQAAEIIDTTPVCAAPRGLAMHPDGALRVTCLGGELLKVTADGAALINRLEADLRDVVIQDGTTYVSWFRSATVGELDDDGNVRRRFRPEALEGPSGARRLGAVGWRLKPTPDGGLALIHQTNAPDEVEVSRPGGYGGGGGRFGCNGISGTGVTHINPKTGAVRTREIDGVVLPVDVAIAPAGRSFGLMVTGAGNSPGAFAIGAQVADVASDDVLINTNCLEGTVFYNDIPQAFGPELAGFGNSQATAVAYDPSQSRYFVFSREPARLLAVDLNRVVQRSVPLGGERIVDTGHALFHRDAGGGIACATCHPEGGDDGFAWTFEGIDGVRRTQMLRGGIKGTEPFHWEGDLADFRALSDEVFSHRMGGPVLDADYAAVFIDYVDRMPDVILDRPTAADDPAVARGEALFNDATVGCAACHVGGKGTDNQSHDVGTGGVFQTPALRNLVQRMPLMHTGCATTLSARFSADCGGGDAHGKTSHLADRQIADLVRYLDSL